MSSINIITNLWKKGLNTWFIKSINTVGALVKPKGKTLNS